MTEDRSSALIRTIGIFSWASIGLLLFVGALIFLIIEGRIVLAPLLLAVVLIYLLNPLVTRLHRRGLPRLLGATLGYLLIIAALVLLGFLVVPSIVEQASGFAAEFPGLYDNTATQVEGIAASLGFENVSVWTYDDLVAYVSNPENQDQIVDLAFSRLRGVTAGIFEFILVFLLGPVLAFYLLIDLPSVRRRAERAVPESSRAEAIHVGRQVNTAIGGFLRGQLLVALIVGLMLSLGYRIIGLEFWLLIGLIGGVLNIVPFLGPWVGGALGVIVALATADLGTALWAVVVAVIVQQIDNNFVSPSVLRATVRLHPALILIVLVLAGAIGGIWGVVIAVPLAATVKIVLGHWWRTRVLGETWEEASTELIEIHEPRRLRRTRGQSESDDQLRFDGDGMVTEEIDPGNVGASGNAAEETTGDDHV